MNKMNSFKISSAKTASKAVEVPVNHIFVIDCSGSMSYDLPKIRKQLKNKLPSLLKQNDTVSLVWFSGKGEFGTLVEKVHINDVLELRQLSDAIDRWLNPIGCTGFVEPLQEVKEISSVEELVQDNSVYSMMFLTDGCDNEWHRSEILSASEQLKSLLSNAVFVEYGYYCNHSLLTDMANATNGTVIFAEDFDKYDPIFDGICTRKLSDKKVEVEVGSPAKGFVWSVSDTGAVSYKVEDGKVYVPEDVDAIYWFDENATVSATEKMDWKPLYQGLSALAMNRESEFVKKQLSDIGDEALYNQYANAFGKQNLYDFAEKLIQAGSNSKLRFTQGRKVGLKPNENAYTVLQLLNELREADAQINLEKLQYNRIGRGTEMSDELTKAETEALSESIANSSNLREIKAHTDAAAQLAQERAQMKFASKNKHPRISSFSYNETRPNVSMLVNIEGTVGLPSDAPSALPHDFPTSVFRNFTVVRDGMVNIAKLPVIISQPTVDKLKAKGVPMTIEDDSMRVNSQSSVLFATPNPNGIKCTIDLRSMPVINAKMVKSVSAQALADNLYENMKCKAAVKVYKGFLDELEPPEKSAGIKDQYGEDCAEYLKSLGITDGGFSPKTKQAEATDKYMAVEMAIKFKGLSTIPSYNALLKKLSSGKALTAGEELLKPAYDECVAKKASMPQKDFIGWLKTNIKTTNKKAGNLYEKAIEDKFSIVVGQTWFSDLDLNNPTLVSNGVDVTFEIKDTEVEI